MMNANKEYSESGNPIYRYQEPKREFTPAFADPKFSDAIDNHIEQFLGTPESVFHEIVSDLVHIDIHIINPTQERNYYTLVTSGMSSLAMITPEAAAEFNRAELLIHLPSTWKIPQFGETTPSDYQDEDWYWPIRSLKYLARFPHSYNTWLGSNHTIPNGDPPSPFASNTQLSGIMLVWPIALPEQFRQLKVGNEIVNFYMLLPLYSEEMNFKLKKGSQALLDKIDRANIGTVLDINRKNTCKKRFGLF